MPVRCGQLASTYFGVCQLLISAVDSHGTVSYPFDLVALDSDSGWNVDSVPELEVRLILSK